MRRLIIEETTVYEMDEDCLRKKQEEAKWKEQGEEMKHFLHPINGYAPKRTPERKSRL